MPIELFAFYYSAGRRSFQFRLPPENCLCTGIRLTAWMQGYVAALNAAIRNR